MKPNKSLETDGRSVTRFTLHSTNAAQLRRCGAAKSRGQSTLAHRLQGPLVAISRHSSGRPPSIFREVQWPCYTE